MNYRSQFGKIIGGVVVSGTPAPPAGTARQGRKGQDLSSCAGGPGEDRRRRLRHHASASPSKRRSLLAESMSCGTGSTPRTASIRRSLSVDLTPTAEASAQKGRVTLRSGLDGHDRRGVRPDSPSRASPRHRIPNRERHEFPDNPGLDAQGRPALVGRGSSHLITIAPALEYSWNQHVVVPAGPWMSVSGRNTSECFGIVAALYCFL
jgi:hypothetical protein